MDTQLRGFVHREFTRSHLRWRAEVILDWLWACRAQETGRFILWVPVALGGGIGGYFVLPVEPDLSLAIALMILCLMAQGVFHLKDRALLRSKIIPTHTHRALRYVLPAVLLVSLGFTIATIRSQSVAAPILARDTRVVTVEGVLAKLEESTTSRRLIVNVSNISGLEAAGTPRKVRLTWRGKGFPVLPGDRISIRAILGPPPEPTAPGAYDFARQLYFEQIGAVGFAIRAPEMLSRPAAPSFSSHIEKLRLGLARRIIASVEGRPEAAAICAALVTGKRDAVPDVARNALRDAGLAHLLAISGLHMGLVAGILFFSVRAVLAAFESLALNYPIKKWAAIIALAGAFIYLLISGSAWSARRAFMMAGIVFVAIIFDRRALSLRNVAIAATVILVATPEALLHAGFQMSFASVTVLIAAYEWHAARPKRLDAREKSGLVGKASGYMSGLSATSILAGVATGPLSLFHFNRMAVYSLFGNLAAMPLVAFWVMPLAVIGVILLPLHLDDIAWNLMARGVEGVLAVAHMTAGWEGAVVHAASYPTSGLVVLVSGGLWVCLNRSAWRLLGGIAIPIAVMINALDQPADILISREGKNVAVRVETGRRDELVLMSGRAERFASTSWLEMAGQFPSLKAARKLGQAYHGDIAGACDVQGCTAVLASGGQVAISRKPDDLAHECSRADIVIAQYYVPAWLARNCQARIFDLGVLRAQGAMSVQVDNGQVTRLRSNKKSRGQRPWSR